MKSNPEKTVAFQGNAKKNEKETCYISRVILGIMIDLLKGGLRDRSVFKELTTGNPVINVVTIVSHKW